MCCCRRGESIDGAFSPVVTERCELDRQYHPLPLGDGHWFVIFACCTCVVPLSVSYLLSLLQYVDLVVSGIIMAVDESFSGKPSEQHVSLTLAMFPVFDRSKNCQNKETPIRIRLYQQGERRRHRRSTARLPDEGPMSRRTYDEQTDLRRLWSAPRRERMPPQQLPRRGWRGSLGRFGRHAGMMMAPPSSTTCDRPPWAAWD